MLLNVLSVGTDILCTKEFFASGSKVVPCKIKVQLKSFPCEE